MSNEYKLDTHKNTPRMVLVRRLWKDYVFKHWPLLIVSTVLMIIAGSMLGLLSFMVRPMFDNVFVAANQDAMVWVALAIFVIFSVRAIAGFGQQVLMTIIGLRVVSSLRKDLLSHLIRLDSAFFSQHSPGALIERVRGDSNALKSFSSGALVSVGRDTITFISLIVVAIIADWQWTLIAFFGLPLLVVPISLLRRWILKTTRKSRHVASEMSTRLDEAFHGVNSIKLNNLEEFEDKRYGEVAERYLKYRRRSAIGKAGLPALIDLVAGFGFVAVVIFGGQQIIDGDKTLGQFMSFFTAMALMFDPLRRLSKLSGSFLAASASLERLYAVLDVQPTIKNAEPVLPMPADVQQRDIVLRAVQFNYGVNPVLNELSFIAPAGKMTALVGQSGAGKTTVFNMLTRMIEPDNGDVLLGDININQFDLHDLRKLFSVVSQDAAMFDETIGQNIALGDLEASEEAVRRAAEAALVTEFSDLLPDGLESMAGPRGCMLSGGQRQRVAIARALLRDAPILLLDEATSALDTRTEQLIQETLENIAKYKTTLVIAHRLSTVMNADMIHVMDAGRVVESGTHEELMAKKGAYFKLHKTLK